MGYDREFPVWAIFASILPAVGFTVLSYLDQNLTSVIVNRPSNNLKKGPGYHRRAEVDAATFTLEAAAVAANRLPALRAHFILVIDCQAAIETLKGGGRSPNLAQRAHDALRRLRALAEVEVFWIPAHDRVKAGWKPHRLASEGWLRGLNDAADKAARAEAARLLRGSQLQRWLRLRDDAVKWEVAAIKAAAAAAKVARAWWWAA